MGIEKDEEKEGDEEMWREAEVQPQRIWKELKVAQRCTETVQAGGDGR